MTDTKWLTIKAASLHCNQMGLPRSTKSLRRWCSKEEVEAQKRKVSNTEKWFIDRESLEIKISEELEFLKHSEKPLPQPNQQTEYTTDISTHDRTQADASALDRSQADTSGRERTQVDRPNKSTIRDLEDQVLILETDKEWRNQVMSEQKQALEKALEKSEAQSRYIGHLETKVMRLGERPDQTFLAAPVPKSGHSQDMENTVQLVDPETIQNQRPHPDQSNLYTG